MLENRDYTLIIDKSGSMSTQDQAERKSRWEAVQESTFALAKKCEEFDPDGITVYVFSSRFRRYDNVTADKVTEIFQENEPVGRTDLFSVLKDALDNYFGRKSRGEAKENGEIFLVITDGEPNDRKGVMKLLIEASRQIDKDEELGISFVQVGNDPKVTEFLKALDDRLEGAGAKFDIVDTVPLDRMKGATLSEVLLNAILD
ncbi:VWA domain-containing protein [Oscillatoriales cyanobacterium LEGE 11467]|uniref:VWA domain-containing protein n=1 Tax=Zarconia navalis LEGE 11467 TaxID=1828826 RepID=A0A928VZB8_9CYAN|nr:VWA domain-containing protein [Zarconia navalis]MBE9041612.1 VWA domain-containing protein [Zarconia navalis LEGE 11467]